MHSAARETRSAYDSPPLKAEQLLQRFPDGPLPRHRDNFSHALPATSVCSQGLPQ